MTAPGCSRRGRLLDASVPIVAVPAAPVLAGLAGAAIQAWPVAAGVALAPVLGFGLVRSGTFRAGFLMFGGLTVFQSSNDVTPLKAWFLVGALVCLAVSIWRVGRRPEDAAVGPMRVLLGLSALFAAFVLGTAWMILVRGTPAAAWARDAAPYLLFASAPLLALDLQASVSKRVLASMVVVGGVLSAIGFCGEWLARRDLGGGVLPRLWLPSFLLASAPFAYAGARFVVDRTQRVLWGGLGGLIVALLLLTGTRSSTVLFVTPVVAAFAPGTPVGVERRVRAGAFTLMVAFVVSLLVPILSSALDVDSSMAWKRMQSWVQLLDKPTGDPSYQERASQTRAAWRAFKAHPVTGAGPGYSFHWTEYTGMERSGFTIDSPLAVLAKFGLLGVLLCLATAGESLRVVVARLRDPGVGDSMPLALACFLATAAVTALLVSPVEDKGFSLAFVLLLAAALPSAEPGEGGAEAEVGVRSAGDVTA